MASLRDAINASREGYAPVTNSSPIPQVPDWTPRYVSYARCPLPPMQVSPDSLRQFSMGGNIPQSRYLLPPVNPAGAGGGVSNVIVSGGGTINIGGNSGSSSGSTNTVFMPPKAQSISFTTNMLPPMGKYYVNLSLAKAFLLLTLNANGASRTEIYGTASARGNDANRGLDQAPFPGIQQDLITDVVLDTLPFQWSWQDRVGKNSDNPQTTTAYVAITNLTFSQTITITIAFVPLES